jgi:hypothetical protein
MKAQPGQNPFCWPVRESHSRVNTQTAPTLAAIASTVSIAGNGDDSVQRIPP